MKNNDLIILKKHIKKSTKVIDMHTDVNKIQRYVGYNVAINSIITFIDGLIDGHVSEEYLRALEEEK